MKTASEQTITITAEMANEIGKLTTKNEQGEHFYSAYDLPWDDLEAAGVIKIDRPTHHTGTPYDEQYHRVEVANFVADWFDGGGNLIDNVFPIIMSA